MPRSAYSTFTSAAAATRSSIAEGVMREEGPLIAWFKDPAGNTLGVLQDR